MAGFAGACLPLSSEMGSSISACSAVRPRPFCGRVRIILPLRAISPFIGHETVRSVSCPKVPRPGALLCESGFRLEPLRLAQNALVRPALSLNQVVGRSLLKQSGCFEADRACEGVGAEALNHRIPMDRLYL
jgi:hypothetical protein